MYSGPTDIYPVCRAAPSTGTRDRGSFRPGNPAEDPILNYPRRMFRGRSHAPQEPFSASSRDENARCSSWDRAAENTTLSQPLLGAASDAETDAMLAQYIRTYDEKLRRLSQLIDRGRRDVTSKTDPVEIATALRECDAAHATARGAFSILGLVDEPDAEPRRRGCAPSSKTPARSH